MQVELIAIPYDSGRRGERMGAGPERLLEAGLGRQIAQAGHELRVRMLEPPPRTWPAEISMAFVLARLAAQAVAEATDHNAFPLLLSGNCGPAALGAVAGLGSEPVVFWFDAHGDFNTPETTIGGFLDGMALATLTGRCWTQLTSALPGFRPAREKDVVLLGARDLDPLEAKTLEASAVLRIGVGEMRERLPRVLADLGTNRAAYLHLDLDVLDPSEGRVNSYAAPGGLTKTELEWAIAAIGATVPLRAASLTSFDPESDASGKACETAIALGLTVIDVASRRRRLERQSASASQGSGR
jgi:arginase